MNRTSLLSTLLPALGLVPLVAACSSYDMEKSDDGAYSDSGYNSSEDGDWDGDGGGGSDDGDDWEPEEEDDFLALRPAPTDAYVFVANPARDTVTRVSVPSLSVITTQVGNEPHVIATTSDYTKAVSFNRGSDTISIIDAGSLSVRDIAVRENFNAMQMSPDGAWVACWYDAATADEIDQATAGGAQSFNEVSFVRLADGAHFPMVVGFNPRDMRYTEEGNLGIVVSDAYLAIIDLTADEPLPIRLQISEDLIDPPVAEEVLITPNGDFAMVRQFGADELVVVDLINLVVDRIPTGLNPTDLDATPDGLSAVAVARGSNELWIYELADLFAEAQVIDVPESEVYGSVLMSPDGTQGLLYSTATGISRYASWNVASSEIEIHSLVKPVDRVGVNPTGTTALVFHDRNENDDVDEESPFYQEWGLTLVDMSDFFSNPLRLPSEPTAFDTTDDGETGFFIMENEPYLEVLDFNTLLYDEVALKSIPVHIGVLPDTRTVYASQEHSLGRLSFYDPDSEQLQTITGFELNAGIED
jgi:DNA-binding beta-propeller fold protein YncE